MCTEESLRVVLNTSPIIILTKLGVLEKALDLFSEVEVPDGVLEDLKRKKDEVYQKIIGYINEGKKNVRGA
ncbi:MAG: hypothetical protein DRZ82_09750 [Thermoprotei archaeon]|nr:MAG: hypothetical protein DRZ82_09750 [Thermoprotei archaeon]